MSPIVRALLAGFAGTAVALILVSLSDGLVGRLYPLPPGVDVGNPSSLREAIAGMPATASLLLVLGWAIAAGAGAFVAARLAPARPAVGYVVAALILLATAANLAMLGHPAWMWLLAFLLIPLLGWLGTRSGGAIGARAPGIPLGPPTTPE